MAMVWTIYNCDCVVLQNIIHSSGSVQDEMAHYLYVLQSITLNHLEKRMMVPLDCYNQVSHPPASTPQFSVRVFLNQTELVRVALFYPTLN